MGLEKEAHEVNEVKEAKIAYNMKGAAQDAKEMRGQEIKN